MIARADGVDNRRAEPVDRYGEVSRRGNVNLVLSLNCATVVGA
jgi:hypothetical protein